MSDNKPFTQNDASLEFILSKGFDVSTIKGVEAAKKWLDEADPDELMYGEPAGDPFDILVGEMRRGMLIDSVESELYSVIFSRC